ncbi:MAG: tetratricopeptide repeat protein [Candidatus Lokiarchaeota archaeon]|nr:tetratricopeptide repeat protein [Candidatus Lokiarchaeota archaeon]
MIISILYPIDFYLMFIFGLLSIFFYFFSRSENFNYDSCISREINTLKRAAEYLERNLGSSLEELAEKRYGGTLEKIIPIYEKVLELTPEDSSAAWSLRSAYFHAREFEKSARVFCKYGKKYQKDQKEYQKHGMVDYDALFLTFTNIKLDDLKKLSGTDNRVSVASSCLAHAYNQVKEYKSALDTAEEVLKLEPNYLYAKYPLAEAYYGLGRVSEAIETFQEILQEKPDYQKAVRFLMQIYLDSDKPVKALELVKRTDPKDPEIWYKIAEYYYDHHQHQLAVEISEHILQNNRKFKKAINLKKNIK